MEIRILAHAKNSQFEAIQKQPQGGRLIFYRKLVLSLHFRLVSVTQTTFRSMPSITSSSKKSSIFCSISSLSST